MSAPDDIPQGAGEKPQRHGWSVAELSLKRPVTAIMFFVSLLVIGLLAAVRLPLEQLPELDAPFVLVFLPYPGSNPQEIETNLIRPVEEALATLPGIKRMQSQAGADQGFVFIELADWDRDVEIAAAQAREKLDAIRDELPEDFQRYQIRKFSTSDEAALRVRLASKQDLTGAYDLLDRELVQRVERVPGVARVELSGAPPSEIEVALDPDRLSAHGIALNDLAQRLRAVNFSVSAGEIDDRSGRRVRVQPVGEMRDLDELRDLVIDERGLRLADVAEVRLKPQRVDYGRRLDGRPAVGIDVYRERNANLVEVTRAVLAELEQVKTESAFEGVAFNIIDDQGESVTSSLKELAEFGLIGILLSVAVLYFFLRHWPSTLMVTLAIPICFVITLGFMYFFGLTLNILTMMGLLLGVGMLVDNAVVVVESIYQEREKLPGNPMQASLTGTRNVAIALSAGTLCHCIVFVPNLFGPANQISIFMVQLAITISVSLLASWLVAVSLIPMLSARMKTPPAAVSDTGFIARLQARYARLLRFTLAHRGLSIAGIVAIVLVSMVPAKFTKFDMFAEETGRELRLGYSWNGSYPLAQMSSEIARVENWLDAHREELQITQIYSWFSESEGGSTMLQLTEDGEIRDTKAIMEQIRTGLPKSARVKVAFSNGDGGGGGGDSNAIQVSLIGDSPEMLREISQSMVPVLAARPQLRDVRLDEGDENSELAIRVDRERAAQYGFGVEEVSNFVSIALRGSQLRDFQRGDSEVPIWVRFAGAQQFRIEDLSGLDLRSADGRRIPLLSLVDVRTRPAATQISRTNRETTLSIQANLAKDVTVPQAREAIEAALATYEMPDGYRWSLDGAFQQDDEAGKQMLFNLLLAVVMIYVVMAAVFESLLFPAAIMSSVLFSILGVFWLFALTGTSFTVMSFIGILVLMGVVVNNGIVMVEHINALRRAGMDRTAALVAGSRERLRPIMMTMGTAILGMLPLCVATTQLGGGGPAYYPMARAIAGGLAFSTVVSLLFLPTIYAVLDDMSAATSRLLKNVRAKAPLRPRAASAME
ncbi:efflux RND transporter permease subunit [Coralloluteibacterium stylophorae]|uniref:Efflux RND transporter permease subunit n=1 Tax=Coralloluteibacterium stylophorae TaxID=1776034 RepID=A0AAP2FWY6_9GAMM|nr:efflux RND transporter permease subunit [Coralloluteibacterium stylophorae]MBS7455987.1 efflux RND transporter permease subunit [Coralloluteibacterium stylophorae]